MEKAHTGGKCTLLFLLCHIWEKKCFIYFLEVVILKEKTICRIVLAVIYPVFIAMITFHSIVEISTSSPLGMQLTTLSNHGQIYQRNVTWYPSQQQIGQQVFCFKAVDSAG